MCNACTGVKQAGGGLGTDAEAFGERLLGTLNEASLALMLSIGHRTRLFDVMSGLGWVTSTQLAERAGLNERYVREWLGAMATGRVVEIDGSGECDRYRLPDAHARVLSRSGESLRPLISITHEDPDCVDFATAFSPDGSQIAYIDEACQAHLLNADGAGQPVPMNRFPWEWRSNFYPQWLNSKYANACRHTNLGGAGLCLTASETESVTRILEDANLDFEQFNGYSWRPDGQQLVFSATEPESPINNLYIVNADGSNLVQLPLPPHELANEPVWSPNGQWLAFHLDGQLAKMRPDGSDLTILYDDYGCFGRPEWSPDSRRLVMTVQTAPAFCEYAFPRTLEMLSIAADGGKIMTITAETYAQECGEEWRIAISPNGQWVAYFNGNCQTQLIRADGSGQPRPLKEFPWWWTSQLFPQWGGQNK